MARARMWSSKPWRPEKVEPDTPSATAAQEEVARLKMMLRVERYCLAGLGIVLFFVVLVLSFRTSFWADLIARRGRSFWP